ncbi:MAG: SIS domain-containing protein [Erysipelotrichaceae bacterium]|nr:SIS domain-containing protein [Erysipelotrichaceae bacterium]
MFESIMWTYMKEEQTLLSNLLNSKLDVPDMEALYIVCHGSSYNAAMAISSFIAKYAKIRVYAYTPSNFMNTAISLQYENKETTYVLGISQTGTSSGVLNALECAKKDGFSILGITNEVDSPIDKMSNQTYYLNCGLENSNAKTKGYSSTLVLLMLFGLQLAQKKNTISDELYKEIKDELSNQVNDINNVIDQTITWCQNNQYGKDMDNLYVIGNGMNFATAMEGQLKLMETQCIPTMFNDIVEFSHGMHRSLNEKSFILLINDGLDSVLVNKTFDYCQNKKYNVVMIDTMNHKDNKIINVNSYKHSHSILLITSVIQAISAFVPELNGTDPNRNANDDYTDWMETRVL